MADEHDQLNDSMDEVWEGLAREASLDEEIDQLARNLDEDEATREESERALNDVRVMMQASEEAELAAEQKEHDQWFDDLCRRNGW